MGSLFKEEKRNLKFNFDNTDSSAAWKGVPGEVPRIGEVRSPYTSSSVVEQRTHNSSVTGSSPV